MRHAFLLNCHRDVERCVRLVRLLRKYQKDSAVLVYEDGPPEKSEDVTWQLLEAGSEEVHHGAYQPDKCRSLLDGLSRLVECAALGKVEVASYLHSDMIPVDWAQFLIFLLRFHASGKVMTWSRMWPNHLAPNFCNLHFRLPEAGAWFPVRYTGVGDEKLWFNEMQLALHLDTVAPGWEKEIYKMGMMVMPYMNQYQIEIDQGVAVVKKLWHTPDFAFEVNDLVPESSVVHVHDEVFWRRYGEIVR